MLVDLVADVEWDVGSKVHKVGTRSLDRSWSPLMDWCHGRLPNLANFHSSWWWWWGGGFWRWWWPSSQTSTQAQINCWKIPGASNILARPCLKTLRKIWSQMVKGGGMCWASIGGIWPGGRGNWSIKEGTDAESGRGQNFGLQNWAENVEDLLQEVDASRSLTRAWHLRHLCVISYTCAPRGTNISSSLIASKLRKTNLHVAASCLAIKEAGHYDARVVAGQRLQRK